MTLKQFCDLPIGTRFRYNGAMHVKLTVGAAQCLQGPHAGTVFSIAATVEVETA